jgi:hypothetical protein
MKSNAARLTLALLALTALACEVAAREPRLLKVYILAGQSNMQGSAHQRTFAAIVDDDLVGPGRGLKQIDASLRCPSERVSGTAGTTPGRPDSSSRHPQSIRSARVY